MKCKFFLILAFTIFLSIQADAATIVKEALVNIPEDKKDLVFAAFNNVNVVYISDERGPFMVTLDENVKIPAFKPYVLKGTYIVWYYDENYAESQRKDYQGRDSGHKYSLYEATLTEVLNYQYKLLKRSSTDNTPYVDHVVINQLDMPQSFTEYLLDTKTNEPYIIETNGERFIPAFIAFNSGAIDLQKKLNGNGPQRYTRVGVDFLTFLDLVLKQVQTEIPFRVFRGDKIFDIK